MSRIRGACCVERAPREKCRTGRGRSVLRASQQVMPAHWGLWLWDEIVLKLTRGESPGAYGMKVKHARDILSALGDGNDPFTGGEVARDSVLHRGDVVRALTVAVAALNESADRAERRAHLPCNVGRRWTPEEEVSLVAAFQSGDPPTEIATRHGRTLAAIEERLEKLGFLTPEQRTTQHRYSAKSVADCTELESQGGV